MPSPQRRKILRQVALLALMGQWPSVFAQPNKSVRLIALEPGAQVDTLARVLRPALATELNATVIVSNHGGAGGRIAAQMTLLAEPDGNTLLVGGANNMVNSPLLSSVGYDPFKDFVPIAPLASVTYALAASLQSGVTDLASLVAVASAAKQSLSAGSAGIGGSAHLALQTLFHRLSLPLLYVPFRGPVAASQEVLAGRLDLTVGDLPRLLPLAREGRLNIVGVTATKRSVLAPDIPTLAEQGVTGFRVEGWYALFCRADVPKSRINSISTAVRRVLADAAFQAHIKTLGFDRWSDSAEAVLVRMKQDAERVNALLASGLLRRE